MYCHHVCICHRKNISDIPKVPVTFGARFEELSVSWAGISFEWVDGWIDRWMNGWMDDVIVLFCVCVALGIVEAMKCVYPHFKASCYMPIRC